VIQFAQQRETMVERQVAARGVTTDLVLDAMRQVPRERFLPADQALLAYDDSPLPIAAGQTISQPYIVAYMIEGLALNGGEKILEIGTGSGYAAAVLAQTGCEVYTIERIAELAESASAVLKDLGYHNVHVRHANGTLGWPDEAPFDGIVVAAGGPEIPDALKQQLKIGGRLIIPVGQRRGYQDLMRVTRVSASEFVTDDLATVRFVPLVGEQGWASASDSVRGRPRDRMGNDPDERLRRQVADACEPFQSVDSADLDPLMARIGDARVVLIGEASHGTSEFYRLRNRITQELMTRKHFSFIAIEGDWPDAARVDHFVRHFEYPPSEWAAFARFPTWMWRNQEFREFVDWLRAHNTDLNAEQRVAFYGLDLYSLYSSIRSVLRYLDDVDPDTAAIARQRYACLMPWQTDPTTYGQAALSGRFKDCENEVVRILIELSQKHRDYAEHDGERFLDAMQNARLIANAERYYRTMYYGSRTSWNLRDTYMFETLQDLLEYHAPGARAIVWAHNSHVGDASATAMAERGEINLGQLCRNAWGSDAYLIGFGTDSGTVAAASSWDASMEIKTVLPSRPGSYEKLFHNVGLPGYLLPLGDTAAHSVIAGLSKPRLQRAIGVIYRPETELDSHYFEATLPQQFDEYIWIDQTSAVQPFPTAELEGFPDTYPFGL
jgi:protein-L-isoaspartate(D-aspartate) O-methyltransferase